MVDLLTDVNAAEQFLKEIGMIVVKNSTPMYGTMPCDIAGVMKHPLIDNREADHDWIEMPEKHTAYFAKWSLSNGFELRTIAYNREHKMFEPVKLYETYLQPPMTVELINEQVVKITDALRKEFIRRENKKIVKDLEVLG